MFGVCWAIGRQLQKSFKYYTGFVSYYWSDNIKEALKNLQFVFILSYIILLFYLIFDGALCSPNLCDCVLCQVTIVQSEDVIIKIRGLSILGRLHAHENQSAGVDVINAQGICSAPGGGLLSPSLPPYLPLLCSHSLLQPICQSHTALWESPHLLKS